MRGGALVAIRIDEFSVSSEHFRKHDARAYSVAEKRQHAFRCSAKLRLYLGISDKISKHNKPYNFSRGLAEMNSDLFNFIILKIS